MELARKNNDFNNIIDLKINKEFLGKQKLSKFKIELENLGITYKTNKNPKYLLVQLPVSLIFYVEYLNKEIKFHLRSSKLILTDHSNSSLVKILEIINTKVGKGNIWSNFIKIKSYYLVRKGDVKGYDNNDKKVLISSVSHIKKTAEISVSEVYRQELFENISSISKDLLFVKSIHNIQYIIYPQEIRCIESHSKSKKIFLENNLFTNLIEIKHSKSSMNIKDFFADEYKTLFIDGMFIQLNRSIIFNIFFFDKDVLESNRYKDAVYGSIKIYKKVLKELSTN